MRLPNPNCRLLALAASLLALAVAHAEAPPKIEIPSACKIDLRITRRGDREIGVLTAEYQFRTTVADARVALGLAQGKLTAATLDGRLPVFASLAGEQGFVLVVDQAGEHTARLELELPVTPRGTATGDRSVQMGLPGCPITTLNKMEFPAGTARIRLGGKPVSDESLTTSTALGSINRLDLVWIQPVAGASEPLLAADIKTTLRLEEKSATARTRIAVKALRGEVDAMTLNAPFDSEVTAEQGVTIEKPSGNESRWTLRRAPSAADFVVDVVVGRSFAVGKPFGVAPPYIIGAAQQRGSITIAAAPNLRLAIQPAAQAELVRRESPEDSPQDAVFVYSRTADSGSIMDVVAERVAGVIESTVQHTLTLNERGWRWQGKIELRPIRTEATAFEIELPAYWSELRPTSAEIVESVAVARDLGNGRKLMRLTFAAPRRRSTSITLEAKPAVDGGSNGARFSLPAVAGTDNRGDQLTVIVPAGQELGGTVHHSRIAGGAEFDQVLEPTPRLPHSATARFDGAPTDLRIWWRPIGRDQLISANVQIHLAERQATIRQEWRLPGASGGLDPVTLRSKGDSIANVRMISGGRLSTHGSREWTIQPTATPNVETTLAVTFTVPLPDAAANTAVATPLLWLDEFANVETTVRVWAGPHADGIRLPRRFVGPWSEIPPQAVGALFELPALSAVTVQSRAPLELVLDDVAGGPGTGAWFNRFWNQVLIEESGRQLYRIRAALRSTRTQYIDIQLPIATSVAQLLVQLDQKRVTWAARPSDDRIARFRVDVDPNRTAHILELTYSIPATQKSHPWFVSLAAPIWLGDAIVPPAHWQIGFAEGRAAIALDATADFMQQWTWDRIMLRPQPAWTTSALSRWFFNDSRTAESDEQGAEAALVALAPADGQLQFFTVPRTIAWIGSSLGIVVLATILFALRGKARVVFAISLACAHRPDGSLVRPGDWSLDYIRSAGADCLAGVRAGRSPAAIH